MIFHVSHKMVSLMVQVCRFRRKDSRILLNASVSLQGVEIEALSFLFKHHDFEIPERLHLQISSRGRREKKPSLQIVSGSRFSPNSALIEHKLFISYTNFEIDISDDLDLQISSRGFSEKNTISVSLQRGSVVKPTRRRDAVPGGLSVVLAYTFEDFHFSDVSVYKI